MSFQCYKLKEVASGIQTGPFGSQLHQSDYSEVGTPVVMPKDIVNGCISQDSIARVSEDHVNRLKRHQIQIGDILYSRRGDVGRCAIASERESGWLCGTGCLRVTVDPSKAVPKYVFLFLQKPSSVGWIEKHAVGATMLNLNTSILGEVPIDLPDYKTQHKVVSIISAYDDLVENNQRQIKLLEEAAQRLYKEWFVDLRFPGYENTPIVDGLPEGWTPIRLEHAISKITTGLNPRKNFVLGQGNNYYVTIKNMGDNTFYLDNNCDRIDDSAISKINKRSDLQVGDLLFSGIGTMGRVALVSIPTNNWNVSESVFTMRANELVSKEFLFLLLLSSAVQSYCDQHAHGVAQRGIRMADIKAFPFALPDRKTMGAFTVLAAPIIEKADVLRKQNKELIEARDRLLPKLMSGEIILSHFSD
ncbi:MAG: restriction endonuclease subunit S [Clostridia bacterium]|nr:restriction endonuclease subunit S [Clostridia bacterium]